MKTHDAGFIFIIIYVLYVWALNSLIDNAIQKLTRNKPTLYKTNLHIYTINLDDKITFVLIIEIIFSCLQCA